MLAQITSSIDETDDDSFCMLQIRQDSRPSHMHPIRYFNANTIAMQGMTNERKGIAVAPDVSGQVDSCEG